MRDKIVWKLWQRLAKLNPTDSLWEAFNRVILRKFGPPV